MASRPSRRRTPAIWLKFAALCLLLAASGPRPAQADYAEGVAAYERGDHALAAREFEPLAKAGDADAQYYLGTLYAEGLGVSRDDVRAHAWLTCAAQGADEGPAAKLRDRLAARMPRAQVDAARRQADGLCPRAAEPEAPGNEAYLPQRESLWEKVLFFTGDMTLLGALEAAEATGGQQLRERLLSLYWSAGDLLIGGVSLVWWLLFARVLYIVHDSLRGPTQLNPQRMYSIGSRDRPEAGSGPMAKQMQGRRGDPRRQAE